MIKMNSFLYFTLKEAFRYPVQAWLTVLTLVVMSAFPGTLLLLVSAVEKTASELLAKAPSLVIRRVSSHGWQPMPLATVSQLKNIPGATEVQPRLWGLCSTSSGAVTIRTDLSETSANPAPGEAVIGPGIDTALDQALALQSENEVILKVKDILDNNASMTATVLVHESDARELFNLTPDLCSDIAVTFFHDAEAEAAIPEIIQALPFRVQITTRQQAMKHYTGALEKWDGLGMLLYLPAILAMFFFLWTQKKMFVSEHRNLGILKMMGWTTVEITWSHLLRSALLGIPALIIGCSLSYYMVYGPGMTWPARFFFGWTDFVPEFELVPMWRILFQLSGFILVPYLVSQLLPLFKSAAADPADLLEGMRQ